MGFFRPSILRFFGRVWILRVSYQDLVDFGWDQWIGKYTISSFCQTMYHQWIPSPIDQTGWAQDLIVTNLVCLWAQDFIEEMGGGISIGPSTASVHGNNVTSLLLSTETPETRGKAGNKPEISRRNIIQGHQNWGVVWLIPQKTYQKPWTSQCISICLGIFSLSKCLIFFNYTSPLSTYHFTQPFHCSSIIPTCASSLPLVASYLPLKPGCFVGIPITPYHPWGWYICLHENHKNQLKM